jgi:hypothetical protein
MSAAVFCRPLCSLSIGEEWLVNSVALGIIANDTPAMPILGSTLWRVFCAWNLLAKMIGKWVKRIKEPSE